MARMFIVWINVYQKLILPTIESEIKTAILYKIKTSFSLACDIIMCVSMLSIVGEMELFQYM